MNGNNVIVGDFNIDWLNTNGSERKRFCYVLETFGFVQNIVITIIHNYIAHYSHCALMRFSKTQL